LDGWNSFFVWCEELYVYVALANLESNFYNDVFSSLDKKVQHNDRLRMDFNSLWR
jgi:hypothetical protein